FRGGAAEFTPPRVASRGPAPGGIAPARSSLVRSTASPTAVRRSRGGFPAPSSAAEPRNSPPPASRRAALHLGASRPQGLLSSGRPRVPQRFVDPEGAFPPPLPRRSRGIHPPPRRVARPCTWGHRARKVFSRQVDRESHSGSSIQR